jgi:DNA-directed RNA polymerase subunit beta'
MNQIQLNPHVTQPKASDDFNNDYEAISIHLASAEEIVSWSKGEVKKAETISYRNYKPEPDGLFCEKIFGPFKDFECRCGKYKGKRYEGVICDRCNVEVTSSKVRRQRMGHIDLAAPVVHIWFLKTVPYISLLLDITSKTLQEIVYFVKYVVIDPGDTDLNKGSTLRDDEYRELLDSGAKFTAKKGAEAIQEMLKQLNIQDLFHELKSSMINSSFQKKNKLVKRLGAVQSFISTDRNPCDMIMGIIPVIPPDLRPLLQLEGGRFATSDLNTLYQRVINRNNRLRKLIEVNAPDIMVQNEKRMLQEAVDALFDNSKRTRPVLGTANRPLRSLSDILKGKEGRFRQNLLGKRVDYSGRSVIVVNPELAIDQCGLPKEMVLELFKPFVMERLVSKGIAQSLRSAKLKIEKYDAVVWSVLDEIIQHHPVLLNRAPTLHRLGVEGFHVTLCEGKAIQIPPLVCPPFNADFDGDQMAVHVPLSVPAIAETETLMISSRNLMSPANGFPIMSPIQDIILGIYYLTLDHDDNKNSENNPKEILFFHSLLEVITAFNHKRISVHDKIQVWHDGKQIDTTVGRAILNQRIQRMLQTKGKNGNELGFINHPLNSKEVKSLVKDCFIKLGDAITADLLEEIKKLGFEYATKPGITIGIDDMVTPPNLQAIIKSAEEKVLLLNKSFEEGKLSENERHQKVVETWNKTTNEIRKEAFRNFKKTNPVHMMATSGARGNPAQVSQMVGIRGLMQDPTGKTIEFPIKNNLRSGLNVLEYFISTHGARKGQADTALKTSDSGYLTRRLVDVAHSIVIRENDCKHSIKHREVIAGKVIKPLSKQIVGLVADEKIIHPETKVVIVDKGSVITYEDALLVDEAEIQEVKIQRNLEGVEVEEITADDAVIEALEERIIGRYAAKNIVDSKDKVIVKEDHLITEKAVNSIIKAGIKKVWIRSPLTCLSDSSVCAKCYGKDLSTGKEVLVGEAVGVIAAQSIGEPGTQLTLRTFHTGGVTGADITGGLPRVEELFEARRPKGEAYITEIGGKISIKQEADIIILTVTSENDEVEEHRISYQYSILPKDGDIVETGTQLTQGSLNPHILLKTRGRKAAENYLIEEVQKVYKSQGVDINDKHIEVIVRQLMKRVRIKDSGESDFLPGDIVDKSSVDEVNRMLLSRNETPCSYEALLLRLTKAASISESFLSAASFQETPKILADAAIKGKIDNLEGLKEAVIVGHPIPAGSGVRAYRRKLGIKSINLFNSPKQEKEKEKELFV